MTLPFRKYSNDPNFFGYPLFYIVEGECVCADCCNDAWENEEELFMPIDHPATSNTVYNEEIAEAVNYENKQLYCSNWNCGERIETAYKEDEIHEEEISEEESDEEDDWCHEAGRPAHMRDEDWD
jgi:hypothetical protein